MATVTVYSKRRQSMADEALIQEAKKRFIRCEAWEGNARKAFLDDLKIANGDSENGYQWPNAVLRNRQIDQRPALTINKIRQHNLNITNDCLQNFPAGKFRAVGGSASYQSAQVLQGVAKYIEYNSNAMSAYKTGNKFQVQAGVGYWRVVTDYAGDDTFDQEIFVRPINNPLSVYIDPDAKEADKSDAKFAFIYDDIPREIFEAEYPDLEGVGQSPLGAESGWLSKDSVRVCEYYYVTEERDKLVAMTDPVTGEVKMVRQNDVPKEIMSLVDADPEGSTKKREIVRRTVNWCKIVADKVVEKTTIPCKYIPIVCVIGEETVIEGQLDRKGHTRAMRDPQRMYNYMSSASVEFITLQGKSPWITPVAAVEGLESYWRTANRVNHAYLPWKHVDDQNNPIPPPSKPPSPGPSEGYLQALTLASQELESVSGQYAPMMGEPSNERSGKAINARQRMGDRATYHYIDNLAVGIRFTYKIFLDMIPKVYDTPRVVKILGEGGDEAAVKIDPQAKEALVKQEVDTDRVIAIFNPAVGKYDVEADIGPDFATQRQEAADALNQIFAADPTALRVLGDLYFKSLDVPMADEMAERWRNVIDPAALGEGPSEKEQELAQQVQGLQESLKAALEAVADKDADLRAKEMQKQIDAYKAETDRLAKLMEKNPISPEVLAPIVAQVLAQMAKTPLPHPEPDADDGMQTTNFTPEDMQNMMPSGEQSQPGMM